MTNTLESGPAAPAGAVSQLPRQLGRDGDAEHLSSKSDRYLTFVLGGEVYALPILDITEIIEFRHLTVVPMMPSFIRGVINLRGRVVPVVDMAARFSRGNTDVARRTSIIIVEAAGGTEDGEAGQDMGIMVDAVNKVVHLGAEDIEPPPAFGAGIRSDFISGMAKYNGEFIIVLDVSRVLSVEEMVLLSKASTSVEARAETVQE
ncbi:chemotaxis protein CheW [Kineosporia sp. R_H_3]|uniref:chemotaxis protein CheW n=1 Tax=Kineosporia sp. R_H_3 TaxID=1961848 RepID=UPI000B4AFD52|nr:chemotaxis protein CheW [Kineosporia sp. R_H_3]